MCFQSAVEKGLKANDWIKSIVTVMNGKGGGTPESAQASGTNFDSLQECLKIARDFATTKLGLKAAGKGA